MPLNTRNNHKIMKQKIILGIASLMMAISAGAQSLRLHGRVIHEGQPVANAQVTEINSSYRVINQAVTDKSGYFTMPASGEKTYIRVTSHGMKRFTRKIGKQYSWEINMQKESDTYLKLKVKGSIESTKLLVGVAHGRELPQIVWVQHLTDNTFALVVPVKTNTLVEQYPAGRKTVVRNTNSRIMATAINIESVSPEEGLPETYTPFLTDKFNNPNNDEFSPSGNTSEYYVYPRFLFTKKDLEYLIDHSREISEFCIDNAEGDNYWRYYTSRHFAKELQKILKNLLK